MDWDRNDRDNFTVQGDIYVEEAGERVTATSYTPPYQQNVDANADLSGGNLLARWNRKIKDGDDIQLQVYYDRTNRHEPNFGELRNTFDLDFLQRLRFPYRQQVSWGLEGRFSLANDLPVVSGLAFLPAKRTDELFSAFVQDEVSLIDNRLSFILGTKLLRTNFTGIEAEPSARLMWTPTSNQSIWTSFTHAVRTPSDAEEDFLLSGYQTNLPNGTPFFAAFLPNKGFQPEQLNGYELGYRRLIGPKLYVDLAAFYNHYHDLFDEEIIGQPYFTDDPQPLHLLLPAQFGNGLRGETAGGEIAPEWRPTSFWRVRGSYSYLNMHIKKSAGSIDIGSAPGINGSSPRHEVGVQSSFDLSKTLQFDFDFRYVSALPAQVVSAYSTGNARFAWRFKNHWELALVGQNLFQPHHFEDGGDPATLVGIRRSAYVKLSWMK
jgi:iron complex outermembrane receptor protein